MSKRSLGPLDRRQTTTLTFDCYGTLVDWERGALAALRGQLPAGAEVSDDALIRAFLEVDARLAGEGLFPYAEVLNRTEREVLERFGVPRDAQPAPALAESLPAWPLFAETNPALERLSQHYRLAIISNVDERLIARTLEAFTVTFDLVMTSERAGVYKPDRAIFAQALEALGTAAETIIHVAEGLCEAEPARALGVGSLWVRRSDRSDDGSGATPDAQVTCLMDVVEALCPEA